MPVPFGPQELQRGGRGDLVPTVAIDHQFVVERLVVVPAISTSNDPYCANGVMI